jgi:hypothetical protein
MFNLAFQLGDPPTRLIESSNFAADKTGVLPRFTTYLGPRTAPAGFDGRMPPVTK